MPTCPQPLPGSQVSLVQGLPSSQPSAGPLQRPFWQVSLTVHRLSSLHALPLVTFCIAHLPVPAWQAFLRQAVSPPLSHTTALPGLVTH